MKVCVLSGSPKGKYSITWQTAQYLAQKFPGDEFETIHVGQTIRQLEKDMSPALNAIRRADLLLFCYPVYTFIVPYQLYRFVELLKASGADISGKWAAQISTSKHFYDTTAHAFVQENCADMGLSYLGGLSADMDDLLCEKGQREAEAFWNLVHWRQENGAALPLWRSAAADLPAYRPGSIPTAEKTPGGEVVIVANLAEGDGELAGMIQDFQNAWPHESRVVNLAEYPFDGGCLGCFHCATTGKCIYKDGFDEFLRTRIQTAAAIVYAFRVSDHGMGARMKLYDDRQFCNGHRTVTAGMPVGYLVLGDLAAEPNLRCIIEGRAEVGGNFLAGIATDAPGVAGLARTLDYALATKLTQPAMFLGVGGMKIFRDLIWLMRGMMKADHQFYREHGLYDFPQKQRKTALKMKLVGALMSQPKVRAKMGNQMNEGMIMPYRKVLNAPDAGEKTEAKKK